MWQALHEELSDEGLVVLTVAMDSRGVAAVRGPITRAGAGHPSLIDRDHVVADLYNMVNVPQAVWIDEEGRIVRPAEVSGAAITLSLRKLRRTRALYLEAIRDWVRNGAASTHAFSPEEARSHQPTVTPEIARAHAAFHLGRHLIEAGEKTEGRAFLREAVDLHPDSWNFFRQMKNLEHILGSGGPEFLMRTRRMKKQGKTYYPLPDMASMAEVAD